jgi:hypothetical protein
MLRSRPGSAAATPRSDRALLERRELGRGDPGLPHQVLRQGLIRTAHARGRTGAGVGDADRLQQPLHGPVLPITAVQRDERRVGLGLEQLRHEVGPDVDRHDLVAELAQRALRARARAQRDGSLQRTPALEDRDLLRSGAHRSWLRRAESRFERRGSSSTSASSVSFRAVPDPATAVSASAALGWDAGKEPVNVSIN